MHSRLSPEPRAHIAQYKQHYEPTNQSMFTASHHGKECPCKKIPMCLSSFSAAEFGDIHSLALRLENRTSGGDHVVDSAGNSPLHLAAQHGQVAAVAYLLRRLDVNVAHGGATPLHRASFAGATATMRLLLAVPNCNVLAQDTSFGDYATALHKACAGGRYLAVQLLLEALSSRGIVEVALNMTNAADETPRQVVQRIIDDANNIEVERASVARWNSVSGHPPDWERCQLILQCFVEESAPATPADVTQPELLTEPCLPDSLRNGSMCRPGDECSDGHCQTSTWECAFHFALMRRVEASTSMVCKIAGHSSRDSPDTTVATTEDDKRPSDDNKRLVDDDYQTARRHPAPSSSNTATGQVDAGRSCGQCGLLSIAFYRRRGLLVCQSCGGA